MTATVSPLFLAAVVLGAISIVGYLAYQFKALDRLGAHLAGEPKARREALARTATTEGAKKVARLAAMLADGEEVRLIRWTPARTADGCRIALGASPTAWYLWLPEPAVLVRVPDVLVAKAEHVDIGDGVSTLRCVSRTGAGFVTATDGVTVEEADDSPTLAHSLLDGLVFVDPRHRDSRERAAEAPARTGKVASVSLAS